MGGTTAQAQVEKKPYKNQTAGWLGVVKLDHLGAQQGFSVEPYGTVYLSDEEAILTARAPKDPKDNPFVEQMFMFQDQHGQQVEQGMRPLVLITDDREVPSDERYVPSVTLPDEGVEAARRETEAALNADDPREVASSASVPTLVPSSGAAVPPSQARAAAVTDGAPAEPEEDVRESWVDNPERSLQPQPGALGGSDEPAPGPVEGDAAKTGSPTTTVQQAPVPQPPTAPPTTPSAAGEAGTPEAGSKAAPGAAAGTEEHAAHLESGEETGAAATPTGEPPEGEYASQEEVGSPDAPTQGGS